MITAVWRFFDTQENTKRIIKESSKDFGKRVVSKSDRKGIDILGE
ncbi:hypothetical protein [Lacrimispora sp.]